jgi:predicted RNA methylase
MSRLMNWANMGYVPTPPSVVERVAAFLRVEGPCHVLDPCCGAGEALAQLRGLLEQGTTFGIELDVARSEAAAKILDQVLGGSYEQASASKGETGVELLWLNPPYATDTKAGRRLELTFLRETQDWLRPGGVLVYIVRQAHLSERVARRLSTWFEDLSVYRFPEEEYQTYQQVVVLGLKRSSAHQDETACLLLLQAAQATLPDLPEIPDR